MYLFFTTLPFVNLTQVITWSNVDLSFVSFFGKHLGLALLILSWDKKLG